MTRAPWRGALAALALTACHGAEPGAARGPEVAASTSHDLTSHDLSKAPASATPAASSAVSPPATPTNAIGAPVPAFIAGTLPCASDDECVVSTFGGCCHCCPLEPYPTRKDDLAKSRESCSRVRCASCGAVDCPLPEDTSYRAVCRDHKCSAVHR